MSNTIDVDAGIKEYEQHLRQTAQVFNDWAKEKNLPIVMDPGNAIDALKRGVNLGQVSSFWNERMDDTGVVHETQIKTAIECIRNLWTDQNRCGHVVGAMQSGKTTASFALQWAGPILYLLKGQRLYPFYIIGNQTGQEDQTTTELRLFLSYYGHIDFHVAPGSLKENESVDPLFMRSPNLATYRVSVLKEAMPDVYEVPSLVEDLVYRRVGGEKSLQSIVNLSKRTRDNGYQSLMIIDEPQFGASDHVVVNTDGETRRKCVLAQIFDRIEVALGSTRQDHWFIGFSATPFEINDLEKVWQVRQYLTDAYSGFNFFNQLPISPGVVIQPPVTYSQTEFAGLIHVPFLSKVVMAAYDSDRPKTISRHLHHLGYTRTHEEYRRDTETALRETVYAVLKSHENEEEPIGLCIRAFNDNARTEVLLSKLALDPDRVEVIKYFGLDVAKMSIKRVISRRKHHHLPYVIFVTNRARMADAFPRQVVFFMDFGHKATDLNSLLQGLLGRACGYNKKSTVVLSDANANIVKDYVATTGGYVHRTSRHSIAVGGYRRGAPSGMLKLYRDMDDEKIRDFFSQIDEQVVVPNIRNDRRLSPNRQRGGYRTGPVLLIAERLGLFDYLESPEVRTKLFPQIPSGFQIARRQDKVQHSHRPEVTLGYEVDEHGNCRYTFRWTRRDEAARGGAAGRAKGKKDTSQHMEPTLYVEKYQPETGEIVFDKGVEEEVQRPGRWRAFMLTFPLKVPVSEVRAAQIALPTKTCAYDYLMTESERIQRDGAEPEKGTKGT